MVTRHRALGGRPNQLTGLVDFGAEAGFNGTGPFAILALIADAPQPFLKFLGVSGDRVPLSSLVIDEIRPLGGGLSFFKAAQECQRRRHHVHLPVDP